MLSKDKRATSAPPIHSILEGIRWTRLLSLSVTVKMPLYPTAVVGKPTMMSIKIVSHFRIAQEFSVICRGDFLTSDKYDIRLNSP